MPNSALRGKNGGHLIEKLGYKPEKPLERRNAKKKKRQQEGKKAGGWVQEGKGVQGCVWGGVG